MQDIPGAGGAVIGVIASVSGGCHCQGANCGTYVYLRSNSGYRLAFSGAFASLRPSRVYKNGHPSLSGKIQVSEAQAESVIYDWLNRGYSDKRVQRTGRGNSTVPYRYFVLG